MSRSRRTGGSFGSTPSGSKRSRQEKMRDAYGTDRHPTAEDFIRAVEENPESYDPGEIGTGPNNLRNAENKGGRGVSGHNLKNNSTSKWLGDNPIDVDVDVDPGSLSISTELYGDENNSVRAVAGVDLVPMGIDINVNGDAGSIGVELGAPGDMFGVNASVAFDVTTGEVIGGGIGVEGGGLAITVDRTSHKGKTCTSVTVTYFGVGASYQHCEDEDDDEDDDDEKEPPPNDEDLPPIPPFPPIPPGYKGWICPVTLTVTRSQQAGSYQNPYIYEYSQTESMIGMQVSGFASGPAGRNYREELAKISTTTEQKRSDHRFSTVKGPLSPPHWALYYYHFDSGGDFQFSFYSMASEVYTTEQYAEYCTQNEDYKSRLGTGALAGYSFLGVYRWERKSTVFSISQTHPSQENHRCVYIGDSPPPPIPPIPPEDDDMGECCNLEPVMSMLRKLNQALAVDEVIGAGLDLPNEWILPTGKGHTKMQNYLQIAVFLAKMQDHLGVHPMTVEIADLSAGQEGNQKFKKFYPNGTKAMQEILTILQDENSDSADRLNLQMRLAILNTRIFVTVASIARSMRGIFQFLGSPLKEKRDSVPLPFDFTYGLRKNRGFSQNAAQDGKQLEETMAKLEAELNKKSESATEALLSRFLNDSDQPIIYETFDNSQPDLLTLLRAVNTQLGKKNG